MRNRWLPPLLLGAGLLACPVGCTPPKPVLHIYMWADYVKPELVQQFQTENNCVVLIDTFGSNESMFARLKSGPSDYDLLFPSSYMVKLMDRQGMLLPINHGRIPNLANVDPEYLTKAMDPQMHHSVPYMLTHTGLAYTKSKVPNFVPSWTMFDRPDLAGRMAMLDDMRETIGSALKRLGFSLNTTNGQELAAARDVAIAWKKNMAKFGSEENVARLASGDLVLIHGCGGELLHLMKENKDIAFAIPAEGTSISCDDMVIPSTARQVELAHRFINFLHEPNVAAANTEFVGYLCPNKEAYPIMNDAVHANPAIFVPPNVRARSEVIADVGPAIGLYTKIWDQVKGTE